VGSLPFTVTGDFNGDGHLDLAAAIDDQSSYNSDSSEVAVLLGNGDGTFEPQITDALGARAQDLVAGDFNGDGFTDLAVANSGNTVSVLSGSRDGTFQPPVRYTVGWDPRSLVAGDFNGDGRIDLATANASPGGVSVLLGNGDGTFRPAMEHAVGQSPDALVAGDFNGDGRIDLAVADGGDSNNLIPGGVSVLLGRGDGTFQTGGVYAVGKAWDPW
jgi:hypothetical protein